LTLTRGSEGGGGKLPNPAIAFSGINPSHNVAKSLSARDSVLSSSLVSQKSGSSSYRLLQFVVQLA
jgi:hypothetical protein